MARFVATAVLALLLGFGLTYWIITAAATGTGRTAAAGMTELAVVAAVVDAGRRRTWGGWFDGSGGRPPAF